MWFLSMALFSVTFSGRQSHFSVTVSHSISPTFIWLLAEAEMEIKT